MNHKPALSFSACFYNLLTAFFMLSIAHSGLKAQSVRVFKMANTPVFTTDAFRAVGVGKGGYVYAGTLRQGFYKYNGTAWEKLTVLTNNSINDIKNDGAGGIWVAQSGYSSGSTLTVTGGINYFPDSTLTGYIYYGTTNGALNRNARSLFADSAGYYSSNRPRIWAAHIGDVTAGVSSSGGVGLGLNTASPFFTKRPGVDSTNDLGAAQTIGGSSTEVWAFASANYGRNQLLRYQATTGLFMGVYDQYNTPQLPAGFTVRAILFARDGRQWLGLASGGLIVKDGNTWTSVNMPAIFPSGTQVNNNALFEDSKGKIYVGTLNGLAIYKGGNVAVDTSWRLMTTADSLPSNTVYGICENKITNAIIVATAGGIAFVEEKLNAGLVWDNSFPKTAYPITPVGVAADGVSRVYMKVFTGDNTATLRKVQVSIVDNESKTGNIKGRLKKAVAPLTAYTEEASTGADSTAIDSLTAGKSQFWFWYVSPQDFCNRSAADTALAERTENVKVVVNYINGTIDSITVPVKIVRPPVVLVHGLASNAEAWNTFNYGGINFLGSPLFKYIKALTMSGRNAFTDNAKTLLDNGNPNSLQYNINALRLKGYAANQVDYICHSMGGLMLRTAIEKRNAQYMGTDLYKNYSKGYVHKLVTINTPHNGSPIADILTEYVPKLPVTAVLALNGIYRLAPKAQKPFDFVEPDIPQNAALPLLFTFRTSPAVRDLQVRAATYGMKMGATTIKNHLITGNVNWTSPGVASFVAGIDPILEIIDKVVDGARDYAQTPADKVFLNSLYALNKAARAWSLLEWYSAKLGYPNFLGSGDLIVPYSSQTARLSGNEPHISNFVNTTFSVLNANHVAIIDRMDVGQRVMQLLNSPVESNVFAAQIPANIDAEPTGVFNRMAAIATTAALPVVTQYDKSKIEIISPASGGAALMADSSLGISIQLKDTVGLAYVKVYFQNNDSATISRSAAQNFSFTVNPAMPDTQAIRAVAVYDKPGQTEYHIDTLIKRVVNNAIPDGFRLRTDTAIITTGDVYYPEPEMHYSGKWVSTSYQNSQLTAQVQNGATVSYQTDKSLLGVQAGASQVYFSYLGFKDTLKLQILPGLYANSVNRTLASGSIKNPAIWSKGRIPVDTDSIVVMPGHSIAIDTAMRVRAIRVMPGGSVQVTNAANTLEVGERTSLLNLKHAEKKRLIYFPECMPTGISATANSSLSAIVGRYPGKLPTSDGYPQKQKILSQV